MKRVLAATGVCTLAVAAAFTSATDAQAVTRTSAGNYHPVTTATRVIDTRTNLGTTAGVVTTGEIVPVQIAGKAGIPATGVQAVVVNLTAVGAQSTGWFTAYPSGKALPATSTLNFPANWTGSVTATIPVGADGKIVVRGGAGAANMLVDVIGWYSTAGSTVGGGTLLNPQDPYRLDDTRYNGGAIAAGSTRVERFGFYDNAGSRLKSVVANITAVSNSTTAGWLTTWNGVSAKPATSSVNYAPGEISPNTTVIPVSYLGADGLGASKYSFAIRADGRGAVNVVVDIVGYYTTALDGVGAVFVPLNPTRLADSRFGTGGIKGKRGTNSTTNLALPGSMINLSRTQAFAGNLTGVGATATTYLTMWSGVAPTDSSTTNVSPGKNRANGSIVQVAPNDAWTQLRYAIYNQRSGTDVIVDITGRFDTSPDQTSAAAANSSKRITSHDAYNRR